jgi:hypothetical protein
MFPPVLQVEPPNNIFNEVRGNYNNVGLIVPKSKRGAQDRRKPDFPRTNPINLGSSSPWIVIEPATQRRLPLTRLPFKLIGLAKTN